MWTIPLKYFKYVRLLLNFLAWIGMGAMNEILGPTLPDLSIRVNADYQEIGRTLGFRIIGNFITPFLYGMLFDRFPRTRDFGFGIIVFGAGALAIAIPFCRQVWILTVVFVLQGICAGGWTTAGQSMIIELFGTSAVSALQFMHFGWGLGSFLASIIVRPFLAPNLKLSKKSIKYSCLLNNTNNATNTTSNMDISGSRIEYAYLIIGCYSVLMGLIVFFFAFIRKPVRPNNEDNTYKKKSLKQMIGPSSISDGKPLFGCFMIIALFLIYTLDVGAAGTFGSYLVTVAIDPCKGFQMSQERGTLLQGAKAAAFSCSRILSGVLMAVLLAKKIQPGIFLGICGITQALSLVLLSVLGLKVEEVFWVTTCVYNFVHAPLYPGCTPWFNQYIHVTSTVISIAVIGSAIGKFAFIWAGGYILKSYSSYAFVYFLTTVGICGVIVILSVFVVSNIVGKRKYAQDDRKRKNINEEELEERSHLPSNQAS